LEFPFVKTDSFLAQNIVPRFWQVASSYPEEKLCWLRAALLLFAVIPTERNDKRPLLVFKPSILGTALPPPFW
jgi:hypothetical protein